MMQIWESIGTKGSKSLWNRKPSLLSTYLMIVLSGLTLLPLTFLLVSFLFMLPAHLQHANGDAVYRDTKGLEQMWHQEAARLGDASNEQVDAALERLQREYPKAGMFWVDANGQTRQNQGTEEELPAQWTPAAAIQFMKERVEGDPFTVVALLGEQQEKGFMVLEVPRALTAIAYRIWPYSTALVFISTLLVLIGFLVLSFLFFHRIRRRLIRLQEAMIRPPSDALHGQREEVTVVRYDEIGRLEEAFNEMVRQLEASKEREAQEDQARRDLIAKLSHDLRTPLTALRAHAYTLKGEPLSERGQNSLKRIDEKIESVSRRMDQLFAYTLLTAGAVPSQPVELDVVRFTKTLLAQWYPLFEQEFFMIESDFTREPVIWRVDPDWLERVLDNYLQNVRRHAKSGRYLGIGVTAAGGGMIVIRDRGPGLAAESEEKGAGLGLPIVETMLQQMGLTAQQESDTGGTTIIVKRMGSNLV